MSGSTSHPSEPTSDAQRTDWRAFITVGIVLALTQMSFYLTSAALPLYLHDLGAAQDRIGLEIGLGSVMSLLVTLVLGPALNRYGAQPFLRVGAAFYVLTSVGMLLFGHEIAITALRAVQGLAGAALIPGAFTLGARLMSGRHATALGILGAMNSIMLALGPPVGLTLYGEHGARWLFLPAVAVAILGLLSTLFLPRIEAERTPAQGFGFDRVWIPSLAGNTLAAMYFGGLLAYLPLFLRQMHGPNAGIFFTADAVGVLLLRIPTGMLADRRGSFLPKLLGLLVTLPGIAALAMAPSIYTLVFSGAATGIGAGLFITGVMGDLAKLSSNANRGTAISLGGGSFNAAVFVGSAISGLLIGPGGFNAILVFGAITTLAALPFVLWRRSIVTP
jgi:MFS family permease